jgi:hypothetical protein
MTNKTELSEMVDKAIGGKHTIYRHHINKAQNAKKLMCLQRRKTNETHD